MFDNGSNGTCFSTNGPGLDPTVAERLLFTYWLQLKQNRAIPRRSDILPSKIVRILDKAFIIEKTPNGGARFRLVGGDINRVLGMDVRGMPLHSLVTPELRPDFEKMVTPLFHDSTKIACDLLSKSGVYKPSLRVRFVLMPLLDDAGALTRGIGILDGVDQVGTCPRYFDGIDMPMKESLVKSGMRIHEHTRGFAEPAAPAWIGKPKEDPPKRKAAHPSERPYLRIIK